MGLIIPGSGRTTRLVQRWNTALGIVLVALVVVLVNSVARERLAKKVDLSQDQLYAPSPELERRLGALDDLLVVRAFFTEEPEHGAAQLARGRLLSMLRDWAEASHGRMRLELVDPSTSSEARLDASRLGIAPTAMARSGVGGGLGVQEVWFGLGLRYRGREAALPLVMPQTLEYLFASEVFRLTRDHAPRIGWVGPDQLVGGPDALGGDSGFRAARRTLQLAGELVDLGGLAIGDPVPDDVELLVVAGPREAHPRMAFAVDQFLQRGGRVILALEHRDYPLDGTAARRTVTGFEPLLAAWGVTMEQGLVWDRSALELALPRTVQGPDGPRRVAGAPVPYPHFIEVGPAGLAADLPATRSLGGAYFLWSESFPAPTDQRPLPEGVERIDLVSSSAKSWTVDPPQGFVLDPALFNAQAADLVARSEGAPHALAISLSGALPSPFKAGGAPEPLDLFEAAVGNTRWMGATTDEEVLDRAGGSQVVLVADVDWLRSDAIFGASNRELTAVNQALLANLADWLLLEEDLLELRARQPRERRLVDFEDQERERLGVAELTSVAALDEPESTTRLLDEARSAAQARRWTWTAGTSFASALLALLVLGVPGVLRSRKRSRYTRGGEAAR